ncbi:MAG: PspC domain-containing protein [Gammaproteobacteria bacterium]|nr:PspC domain-containing protein [Gammaproteobacteria bacterium]
MSKDKREAERAARRAKRLAERAEERAKRKERHAQRAAERADRLAERVKRRPQRERDIDKSIEDLVDEVTEKAEAWIDEQTQRLFESSDDDREIRRAETKAQRAREEAEKARENARRAGKAADDLSEVEASLHGDEYIDDPYEYSERRWQQYEGSDKDLGVGMSRKERKKAERSARRRARKARRANWRGGRFRRPRSAHLYRDRQRKKICGVCAGTADYFGRPVWEIRVYAVLGVLFIPSVVIPAYFIMYFLMDDKPYYRRVTDRFEEGMDRRHKASDDGSVLGSDESRGKTMGRESAGPQMNNVQAMKTARDKFSNIEQRLRHMETHVTSSRFELQRELKKISGDD